MERKKRLEVAQAIVLEPKILILDEPDSGLDVEGVRLLAEKILDLRDRGLECFSLHTIPGCSGIST